MKWNTELFRIHEKTQRKLFEFGGFTIFLTMCLIAIALTKYYQALWITSILTAIIGLKIILTKRAYDNEETEKENDSKNNKVDDKIRNK